MVGDRKYSLLEIEKPAKGNYIQLEAFSKDKEFARVIHVLKIDKGQIKIGRGHESDVKINDISVSRIHAIIKLTPKGFVLEDNESKFGSLMLLPPEPYEIGKKVIYMQIGRSMLQVSAEYSEPEKSSVVAPQLLSSVW